MDGGVDAELRRIGADRLLERGAGVGTRLVQALLGDRAAVAGDNHAGGCDHGLPLGHRLRRIECPIHVEGLHDLLGVLAGLSPAAAMVRAPPWISAVNSLSGR